MKKIVILAALLFPVYYSRGQKTSSQLTAMRNSAGAAINYRMRSSVPAGTFPVTDAGRVDFLRAIQEGQYARTVVENGYILEVGVRAPQQMPTGPDTGPAPITGSIYDRGGYAEGSLADLLAMAPFVPDDNQVSSWVSGDKTIENSQVKIGLNRFISGEMTILTDKRYGDNDINTYVKDGAKDTGRSKGSSGYGGPFGSNEFPFIGPDGQSTAQTGDDTGYNGVAGGSRFQDKSELQFYQRKTVDGFGEVDYTRIRMKQWSLSNTLTEYIRHSFYWVDGPTQQEIVIFENFRTDNQKRFQARQQEFCFEYGKAENFMFKMEFTPGVIGSFAAPEPFSPRNDGSGLNHSSPTSTGVRYSSKNYMHRYNPSTGRGTTIFQPWNSRFEGKQNLSRSGSNPDDFDSSYSTGAPIIDLDTPSTIMMYNITHVGTIDEFRAWLSAAKVKTRPFNFSFQGGRFDGWASLDGALKRINGELVFGYGDAKPYNANEQGNAVFLSPSGSWAASSMPTLKMNMAVADADAIEIRWIKAGQSETDAVMQRKVFPVTGDNVFRDYAFSMAGTAGWDGTICQVIIGKPINKGLSTSARIRPVSITA